MELFKALKHIKENKENIVITIISGENKGNKLLLSDGVKIYTNNENYSWDNIINLMPPDKRSKIVCLNNEKVYIEHISKDYNIVVCGAGHISISIIKMCKLLNLPVTVIDDRLKFINDAKAA